MKFQEVLTDPKTVEQNLVHVPFRKMEGIQPNACFANAEMLAEQHGGRPVLGWRASDAKVLWYLLPHAVWEDASGKWWEVTPTTSYERWEAPGFMGVEVGMEETVAGSSTFLPDEDLGGMEGTCTPGIFLPRIPEALEPCQFLNRAEAAVCSDDRDRAFYWDGRARRFLGRHAVNLVLVEFEDGSLDYLAP